MLLDASPDIHMSGRARTPVQGEVPNPLDPPAGCAFNPRCPHANERCRAERPVLLVHADDHRYRLEPKVRFPSGEKHDNVTRLGVFGAGDIHAVQVTVDPTSKAVFLAGPLLVPGNPLPVLPRSKKEAGKK